MLITVERNNKHSAGSIVHSWLDKDESAHLPSLSAWKHVQAYLQGQWEAACIENFDFDLGIALHYP